MEPELEKLLGHKAFDQLSRTEKEYVLESMTEEAYEQYSIFLDLFKKSSEEVYLKINCSPSIKEGLKRALLEKYNQKDAAVLSQENRASEKSPFKIALTYLSIAASIVLAVVLFFQFKDTFFPDPTVRTTAMDIDQIENFELLREQMSLNETGIDARVMVPEENVEGSLMRPDTLFIP